MEAGYSSVKDFVNSAGDSAEKLTCDLCEIFDIHKNDFENHLKSRGHRKKLRKKDREREKESGKSEEERFECEYCNRTIRGEEFYKAHLGSKTHKRNLKRFTTGQTKSATASAQVNRSSRRSRKLIIGTQDEIGQIDFIRQKYKIRLDRIEDLNYKAYIYSLTAYLSLRLALDQNVEDFKLSVNDREWQVFGDVVIYITYKEKKVLYVIQCKKITQAFKQIEQLEEAKIHVEKQYQYLAQLKGAGKDVLETKFVIFTTCSTNSNFVQSVPLKAAILNKWSTSDDDNFLDGTLKLKSGLKKNEIINVTNDPENIYSFILSDNVGYHLPQLFLYTGQRILPSMLNQLLKQKFDRYPDISTDFMKYIERWIDGKLGGNYKLKKKDVVLKVGEILLGPYIVSPKNVHSKHDAFDVWNQVISRVDLTVVKNESYTISKICRPLNIMIEETLSTTIDTITKSIHLKHDTLHQVGDPIKSYFFEVVRENVYDDIPLHLVYNVFWKAGKIPLLMSSEKEEEAKGFILDVIMLMKKMGVHKKFLIKSANLNLNRYKETLKIFTCLDDVKEFVDWNEVKIRVSDSFELSLSEIQNSDPFFSKWVTPNMFFDIAVGKYSLKPSYSPKKLHRKKDILKLILSDDVKDNLEYQLYPEIDISETDSRDSNESRLRGVDPHIL
ncbi:uncharacterized protein LOC108905512 [Anoplophora glabripennis]|uniref:uncharacterized protein LOC108905512 n=1 Tax=Anoplophora glabripennis TaxID=217634 RepID=UPI0008735080|nr:uncharacterized protein LOC108905512 [Anoplophora glabripennis]